ncbi:Bug family tripartite tricarboxylate transporter substrate binding protein [Achromobacter insolitus]|uniref:Bug family tripartite tricarboxylate transporter substrate binding protein n=1 Tax=Achromobacter insolitus TaxID=217204 RepID=UPI001EF915B5|nr:tripartite tricarboxylate transporter substrate binding protein [Achromobacter insolitus]
MRKRLFLKALLALAAGSGAATCWAQAGDKPIEWVHPYPVGGGSDAIARKLAESVGAQMGRSFFVSNKPGGATNIAAAYVANAKGNGNMVFTGDFATLAANPHLFANLPYDSVKDFVSAGLYARYPILLVVSSKVPAGNLDEFLQWARANPDSANFASSGVGSPQHLAAELFRERTGLKMTHVAYRGGAPAVTDLMAGSVSFALMDASTVVPQMKTGRLKVLGVASPQRMKHFPDIPTLHEQGLTDFEAFAWQGMLVPAGTPRAAVNALNRGLAAALKTQAVIDFYANIAVEPWFSSPDEMAAFVANENSRWGKIIRERGITLQ